MNSKLNLIFLSIDSLRFDHLSCFNYVVKTTPNIDKITNKSIIFNNAFSCGGGTPESFPSVLASVIPPLHQGEYKNKARKAKLISEILKENGYTTAAFHSNPYISKYYYYNKGFDIFEDGFNNIKPINKIIQKLKNNHSSINNLMSLLEKAKYIWGPPIMRAEQIYEKATDWLMERNEPFFCWLHFMDVHTPYMPPHIYYRKLFDSKINTYKVLNLYRKKSKDPNSLTEKERLFLIKLYDSCIKYVDDVVGRLYDFVLNKKPNTIIVIFADHGEEFYEHGHHGHGLLYDSIIRIPLIIYLPWLEKKIVVDKLVSTLRLAPTLLKLLNLPNEKLFIGKSLCDDNYNFHDLIADKYIIGATNNPSSKKCQLSCRTKEWKYIMTLNMSDMTIIVHRELYDLKSDPLEKKNLYDTTSKIACNLEVYLKNNLLKRFNSKQILMNKISFLKESKKI